MSTHITLAPTCAERVTRLATDAGTGADDHDPPAVEAQQPGVVGDDGVVDAGHDATGPVSDDASGW